MLLSEWSATHNLEQVFYCLQKCPFCTVNTVVKEQSNKYENHRSSLVKHINRA